MVAMILLCLCPCTGPRRKSRPEPKKLRARLARCGASLSRSVIRCARSRQRIVCRGAWLRMAFGCIHHGWGISTGSRLACSGLCVARWFSRFSAVLLQRRHPGSWLCSAPSLPPSACFGRNSGVEADYPVYLGSGGSGAQWGGLGVWGRRVLGVLGGLTRSGKGVLPPRAPAMGLCDGPRPPHPPRKPRREARCPWRACCASSAGRGTTSTAAGCWPATQLGAAGCGTAPKCLVSDGVPFERTLRRSWAFRMGLIPPHKAAAFLFQCFSSRGAPRMDLR